MYKLFIIVEIIIGLVFFYRNDYPWWAYMLLLGGNLLFYLIGDDRGWFDK